MANGSARSRMGMNMAERRKRHPSQIKKKRETNVYHVDEV